MNNLDIRLIVSKSGLKYNKIAEKMGVTPNWLYMAMRRNLSDKNRERIFKALEELGVEPSKNKFLAAADQLENITALYGGIDYGKRTKAQIKALDDAIELAIDLLRREGMSE